MTLQDTLASERGDLKRTPPLVMSAANSRRPPPGEAASSFCEPQRGVSGCQAHSVMLLLWTVGPSPAAGVLPQPPALSNSWVGSTEETAAGPRVI